MVTDQLADLLTRIRNAQRVSHLSVSVSASGVKERILNVLIDEGYIAGYEKAQDADKKPILKINLRYTNAGAPAIREIKRLSKPGRRSYVRAEKIPVERNGLGTVIISTSKGVMSGKSAREQGVGGELICSIF